MNINTFLIFIKFFWVQIKKLKKPLLYVLKKSDLLITSTLNPQVLCILFPIILGTYFHKDILDTVTSTQAKMLLQKENLDPLQHEITEIWIATNSLIFLLKEYGEKRDKREDLTKAYIYWLDITKDWKNNWKSKFYHNLYHNLKKEKQETDKLKKQFDDLVDYFEIEFFNKLSVCYEKYFPKNKPCKSGEILPVPANITEFQRKIYSFYIYQNETLKN